MISRGRWNFAVANTSYLRNFVFLQWLDRYINNQVEQIDQIGQIDQIVYINETEKIGKIEKLGEVCKIYRYDVCKINRSGALCQID